MSTEEITTALNNFVKIKYPGNKGIFIAKEWLEEARLKAFKKYNLELYFHTSKDNLKVFTYSTVDRCSEGQEKEMKDRVALLLLGKIFADLDKIENEIV